MDSVATNTVKSQKRRNGASIICFWGEKNTYTVFAEYQNNRFNILRTNDDLKTILTLPAKAKTRQEVTLANYFVTFYVKSGIVWRIGCNVRIFDKLPDARYRHPTIKKSGFGLYSHSKQVLHYSLTVEIFKINYRT